MSPAQEKKRVFPSFEISGEEGSWMESKAAPGVIREKEIAARTEGPFERTFGIRFCSVER